MRKFSLVSFVLLFSVSLAHAQDTSLTPAQIIKDLPAPLPVQVVAHTMLNSEPLVEMQKIASPAQQKCIKDQLKEIQKVADAAGGNKVLIETIGQYKSFFKIVDYDNTVGHLTEVSGSRMQRAYDMKNPRTYFALTSVVTLDDKHKPVCDLVSAKRIIHVLKTDLNHPMSFPNEAAAFRANGPSGNRSSAP